MSETEFGLYESFVREALLAWRNTGLLEAGHVDSFILEYARKKDKEV